MDTQPPTVVDVWFLAAGTFNCVFEIGGAQPPTVCRITVVPKTKDTQVAQIIDDRGRFLASRGDQDNEEHALIHRARFMLTFLTRFRQVLGPSFVHELGQVQIFAGTNPLAELASVYRVNWGECTKLVENAKEYGKKIGYSIVVQKMEKLGNPWSGFNLGQIFSLLWFFAKAHRAFRFRHHDLKPQNLLTRVYEKQHVFVFKHGNRIWKFPESNLPVVIDLDFATIRGTQFAVDRNRLGSYSYAPPDAIFREFLIDSKHYNRFRFNPDLHLGLSMEEWRACFSFGPDDQDGYDLWSIGLMILANLVPSTFMQKVIFELWPLSRDFANMIQSYYFQQRLEFPPAPPKYPHYLRYLFINTVISCAILTPYDAKEWDWSHFGGSNPRYSGKLFKPKNFNNGMATNAVVRLHNGFHTQPRFDQHRTLIQRLMAWEPTQRGGSILEDLSEPGQAFYPFLVDEAEMQRVRTLRRGQIFKYDPAIMEGTQEPLLTPEEIENLKNKI